jgi:hypothetical protein
MGGAAVPLGARVGESSRVALSTTHGLRTGMLFEFHLRGTVGSSWAAGLWRSW